MLDWGHTGYALFLYRFLPRGGEAEGGRIFENLQALTPNMAIRGPPARMTRNVRASETAVIMTH